MNNSRSLAWSIIGLCIALLAIPLVVTVFRVAFEPAAVATVCRELVVFALAALLIWIATSRESESLASLGLWRAPGKQVAWWTLLGVIGCIATLAIGMLAIQLFGLRFGSAPGTPAIQYPLWLTLLTVIRAGCVEELFYRAYAIDRLQRLSGSRAVSILVPLLCFAGFHYRQGAGGVLVALLMGGALTALYLWKRNLLANSLAHFLIDFVPNILLPMLSGD